LTDCWKNRQTQSANETTTIDWRQKQSKSAVHLIVKCWQILAKCYWHNLTLNCQQNLCNIAVYLIPKSMQHSSIFDTKKWGYPLKKFQDDFRMILITPFKAYWYWLCNALFKNLQLLYKTFFSKMIFFDILRSFNTFYTPLKYCIF